MLIRVGLISLVFVAATVSIGHANAVTKRTDTYFNLVYPKDRFGINNVGKILRGVLDTNGLPVKMQDRVDAVKLPVSVKPRKIIAHYHYSRG